MKQMKELVKTYEFGSIQIGFKLPNRASDNLIVKAKVVSQGPEDDRIRVEFNWLNPSQKFRYKFDRKGAIRFGSQILKARACITLH